MPDDYPSPDELTTLRTLDIRRPADARYWLDTAMRLWAYPTHVHRTPDDEYVFVTGGWSGNEDIIEAMQANVLAWSQTWEASERGGRFRFRVPT